MKPKWVRFRFSLRTMLIVVALFSLWLGFFFSSGSRQSRRVKALQAGHFVYYAYQFRGGAFDATAKPSVPTWALDLLGPDYFYRVVSVNLNGANATAKQLKHLEGLNDLTYLGLDNAEVSDEVMRSIGRMSNLRSLEMVAVPVTDAQLRHLSGLNRLEELSIDGRAISNKGLPYICRRPSLRKLFVEGLSSDVDLSILRECKTLEQLTIHGSQFSRDSLQHLRGLDWLTRLSLRRTSVPENGMQHLAELRNLVSLDLSSTGVSDSGLKYLSNLSNLKSLELNRTSISSDGLRHLGTLKGLEFLQLAFTGVDDAGLEHLRRLNNLKQVHLIRTNVSPSGVKQLQSYLPDCDFYVAFSKPQEIALPE